MGYPAISGSENSEVDYLGDKNFRHLGRDPHSESYTLEIGTAFDDSILSLDLVWYSQLPEEDPPASSIRPGCRQLVRLPICVNVDTTLIRINCQSISDLRKLFSEWCDEIEERVNQERRR